MRDTLPKVLLVEDDRLSLELAATVLELEGCHVSTACSVPEGRQQLADADEAFDLMILDIGLPGGGGEVLLRAIRSDPRHGAGTVVAVTAFAMESDRERLLAQGFDGYFSKPIDTLTFWPSLRALLEGERA